MRVRLEQRAGAWSVEACSQQQNKCNYLPGNLWPSAHFRLATIGGVVLWCVMWRDVMCYSHTQLIPPKKNNNKKTNKQTKKLVFIIEKPSSSSPSIPGPRGSLGHHRWFCGQFCPFHTIRSISPYTKILMIKYYILIGGRPQSCQLAEPLWTDPGIESGISVRELISI